MDFTTDGRPEYPNSTLKSWGGHSDITGQGGALPNGTYTPPATPIVPSGDGALDDYVALVEFYKAAGGASWNINGNWLASTNVCAGAWYGTVCENVSAAPICDAGHVCGLCLKLIAYPRSECPSNEVLQAMPSCEDAALGELCEADGECGTSDDVDNCGTPSGYDVYRKIAMPQMERRLTRLMMPGNGLVGVIPAHLALAAHLQRVEISESSLSGTLPSELGLLTRLHLFTASENNLIGTLPPALFHSPSWLAARCGGHLSPLGTECTAPAIYLSSNSLSGVLPTELGTLRSTSVTFHCGDGSIAAADPSTDGYDYCADTSKCPCGACCYCSCQVPIGLSEVVLHRNRISGSLPTELGRVELPLPLSAWPFSQGRMTSRLTGKLQLLSLKDNSLSGTIPSTLGNLTSLRELRLKNNLVSGTLPDSVRVYEGWPQSYGVQGQGGAGVPSELAYSRLRVLELQNNWLSGSIPPSLADCASLINLHRAFRDNFVSGTTPMEWAGHLTASQSLNTVTRDAVTIKAANIPVVQRLRPFRVDLPAVETDPAPPYRFYESRDACFFNPNILFRCPDRFPADLPNELPQAGHSTCETSLRAAG